MLIVTLEADFTAFRKGPEGAGVGLQAQHKLQISRHDMPLWSRSISAPRLLLIEPDQLKMLRHVDVDKLRNLQSI